MRSLTDTIRSNSRLGVQNFLECGGSPNEIDDASGLSALAIATENGDKEIVEFLLDAGADPNAGSAEWPLALAARKGHTEIVELLLASEAGVDPLDEDDGTPLMDAACAGHIHVVSLLIEAGADPKRQDRYGRPAIVHAAEKRHDDVVAKLLPLSTPKVRQQVDLMLRLRAQGPLSPAIQAYFADVQKGNLHGVAGYLASGGVIETMDSEGRTALHLAAQNNQVGVLKYLVEEGANQSHIDENGACPLEYATGCPAAFNYLYPLTPKKLRKTVEFYAPFLSTIELRLVELTKQMTSQGDTTEKQLAFHKAAQDGELGLLASYLRNGGNVDAMDEKGATALAKAAVNGRLEGINLLLEDGADVNHIDVGWSFALLAAGMWNKCFCYKVLQPLTDEVLRDFSDSLVRKRGTWWM